MSCQYLFKKGKKKGEMCMKKCDGNLCRIHIKKDKEVDNLAEEMNNIDINKDKEVDNLAEEMNNIDINKDKEVDNLVEEMNNIDINKKDEIDLLFDEFEKLLDEVEMKEDEINENDISILNSELDYEILEQLNFTENIDFLIKKHCQDERGKMKYMNRNNRKNLRVPLFKKNNPFFSDKNKVNFRKGYYKSELIIEKKVIENGNNDNILNDLGINTNKEICIYPENVEF